MHNQICPGGGFCNPDVTDTRYGTYDWPETAVNDTVRMECMFGSETNEDLASRACLGVNQWMDGIDPGLCFSKVTMDIQNIGVS